MIDLDDSSLWYLRIFHDSKHAKGQKFGSHILLICLYIGMAIPLRCSVPPEVTSWRSKYEETRVNNGVKKKKTNFIANYFNMLFIMTKYSKII